MEIQRESIFISALRSFCRMFFAVCGIFLAFILMSLLYSSIADTSSSPEEVTTKIKYLPDANGNRQTSLSSPVILQVDIHGMIGVPKKLDSGKVENILLDSRVGALKDNRVKGILLHFNTPGGSVVASDNIYRMLITYKERYKVPVFAYVDGLCASGGMYVSCAADKIYAGPASLTGSVGVISGPYFNIYDTLHKIGAKSAVITAGLDKAVLNAYKPWKPDETRPIEEMTAFFYNQFVDIVTTARPRLSKEKLIHEYGANVFDSVRAQEYGYVDYAGASREEALLALLKEAGVDPEKTYQVIALEPKFEWLQTLIKADSPLITGKIEHTIEGASPIRDQISYLYQPLHN